MLADVIVIVYLNLFRFRVVFNQADVGHGKINLVPEHLNVLRRKQERKAAVPVGLALLRPAFGIFVERLHQDVVRQNLVADQVKPIDPGGAYNVEDISVAFHRVNVPVEGGRRVQRLPDLVVIQQLGKGVLRDDGNTRGRNIVGSDPQISFVVDHQVQQLALVVQVSGQGRNRLAGAEIDAVQSVHVSRDEQNLIRFGIQHLVHLVRHGKIVQEGPAFHVVSVNRAAVLSNVQGTPVGIQIHDL